MIDREALKKAVDAYHAAGNGYAWFQKGTNWPAPIEAAITAYLTHAGEGAVPVAWRWPDFIWPTRHWQFGESDPGNVEGKEPLYAAPHPPRQDGAREGEVMCGACGQPWTGEKCGQALNDWPHPVCYPTTPPAPDEAEFWCRLLGEAIDALDECAGDDEEGWDRQEHARISAEAIRAKYQIDRSRQLPPDEAVEAEREACIAALEAVVPYCVTEGGVMHRCNALSEGYYDWIDKHEAIEAIRARSRRDVGGGV